MKDIFLGNNFKLLYNTDTGNASPQGIRNTEIDSLSTFPVLSITSQTTPIETYDNEYLTKLLAEQSVSAIAISVSYIPDNPTHMFLDSMADTGQEFQLIFYYDDSDNFISYSVVNGAVSSTNISGDKDAAVTKTYSFETFRMVQRAGLLMVQPTLNQGDFGVGSNGIDVPQYQGETGNGFIKVPASEAGNPTGTDLLGIVNTDNGSVTKFSMTKTGTLSLFAKNANTAWTRIYTATQTDANYVPLLRTVNGHALTSNVVVTKADVLLGNVLNVPSYSKTESDSIFVPKVTTVNGHSLSSNVTVTASDVLLGNVLNVPSYSKTESDTILVPKTTTVNGHSLSDDIVVTKADVLLGNVLNVPSYSKAEADITTATLAPKTITVNGHALSNNINITKSDVGLGLVLNVPSYSKAEADITTATLVPKNITVNGHALSNNINITKSDVGLSEVTNDPQLKISSNLSDIGNVTNARTNLGLGTSATVNVGTSGAAIPLLSTANAWSGIQTFTNTIAGSITGTSSNVTGVIAIANGGTGAATVAAARTNLGAYGNTGGDINGTVSIEGQFLNLRANASSGGWPFFIAFMAGQGNNVPYVRLYQENSGDFTVMTNVNQTPKYFQHTASGDMIVPRNISCVALTQTSDRDKKKDITTIINALDKVNAINGVTFNWKANGLPSAGIIAQELMEVLPECISTVYDNGSNRDAEGVINDDISKRSYAVEYSGVIALAIEAIKELSEKLSVLESKINK